MPTPVSIWSQFPELVDKLKEMFQGHSFGTIAKELGHGLTRCAVIGKANRLGLKRPKQKNQSATVGAVKRKKQRLHIGKHHPITPYTEDLDMTPVVADTEIPLAQRKTIYTIGMHDCRFPVGDPAQPDFFFCGAPKIEGSPYCRHHTKRCFNPDRSASAYLPSFRRG